MKQQRSINNNADAYLKFLKPGALARLRDSRIRFTTKTSLPLLDLVPSSSTTNDVMQVNLVNDEIPNFVTTTTKINNNNRYGPRCPQRKKLVANKAMMMMFINSETAAVVAAAGGSDNSNSNFVAAH